MTLDVAIFNALNGLAGHGALLDWFIKFCASYVPYLLAILLVIIALWPIRRYRMFFAAVLSGAIARLALKPLILVFIHRARPYIALPTAHNVIGPQLGEEFQSFPSGHAVFFFALAMAIFMYNRKWGWVFFAGATLMGLARIAGGIHWPSDILGGAIIGILTAWVTLRFIPALRPRPLEKPI